MKNLFRLLPLVALLVALLVFPLASDGVGIAVMADEDTGTILAPSNLEARIASGGMTNVVTINGNGDATIPRRLNVNSVIKVGTNYGYQMSYGDEVISRAGKEIDFVNGTMTGFEITGDWLTEETADGLYQPIGSYLTASNAQSLYQPIGQYLTPSSLSNLSNGVSSASRAYEGLSNAVKRADYAVARITPSNGTATLTIDTNAYYLSIQQTCTNFSIQPPTNRGALYLMDIDYSGTNTFAWGGSLASCTNLPTPPPTGKSTYVLQWLTDSTNFIAY